MSANIFIKNGTSYCTRLALLRLAQRSIHMGRVVPEVDHGLGEQVAAGSVDLKKIVTRRKMGFIRLPATLQTIAEDRIMQFTNKEFRQEARQLIDIMRQMKLPDDQQSLAVKKSDIATTLEVRDRVPEDAKFDTESIYEDTILARDKLKSIIMGTLSEKRRDWHYYEYDLRAAHMYMAARLAPNYACIKTVLKEINDLDPNFKPKSVLDFGSGLGTAYWAINDTWPDHVYEFMNVDISKEQQHLAECLIRNGNEYGHTPPGIFYKQYLPTSTKVKYDLIISAFTLLELPSRDLRANVIENLWHKTNDLLVLIERGNRGGFATLNEARNFILDLSGHDVTKKINFTAETRPIFKHTVPSCHVFAPCSHEFTCPRAQMSTKLDRDICRFRTFYEPLNLGEQKPGIQVEEFSYLVLRKQPHPTYLDNQCPMRWPRIVEKRNKGGKQVTHKLCCPNGSLATTTVTAKKYGKSTYEVAKASDWGDILPIKVCDTYVVKNSKLIGAE